MIGLLGGTFDPIHYGHLRVALEIRDALDLKEVRFLPCRYPPHRDHPGVDPETRASLVALAIAGTAGFVLDRRELQRDGPSYSYDTLRSLREEYGPHRSLGLILGADAFAGLPDWHRVEALLELTHVIVARRPGETQHLSQPLEQLVHGRITDRVEDLHRTAGGRVMWVPVTQLAISATAIRGLLQHGADPRFLMPDAVLEAIRRQGLYGQAKYQGCSDLGVK